MFHSLDCMRTYAGSSCSSAGKNADLGALVAPVTVGKTSLLLSMSLDRNSKHLRMGGCWSRQITSKRPHFVLRSQLIRNHTCIHKLDDYYKFVVNLQLNVKLLANNYTIL